MWSTVLESVGAVTLTLLALASVVAGIVIGYGLFCAMTKGRDKAIREAADEMTFANFKTAARWFSESNEAMLAFDACAEHIENGRLDAEEARYEWRKQIALGIT